MQLVVLSDMEAFVSSYFDLKFSLNTKLVSQEHVIQKLMFDLLNPNHILCRN